MKSGGKESNASIVRHEYVSIGDKKAKNGADERADKKSAVSSLVLGRKMGMRENLALGANAGQKPLGCSMVSVPQKYRQRWGGDLGESAFNKNDKNADNAKKNSGFFSKTNDGNEKKSSGTFSLAQSTESTSGTLEAKTVEEATKKSDSSGMFGAPQAGLGFNTGLSEGKKETKPTSSTAGKFSGTFGTGGQINPLQLLFKFIKYCNSAFTTPGTVRVWKSSCSVSGFGANLKAKGVTGTSGGTNYRNEVLQIYQKYNPQKVGEIDKLMQKIKGTRFSYLKGCVRSTMFLPV